MAPGDPIDPYAPPSMGVAQRSTGLARFGLVVRALIGAHVSYQVLVVVLGLMKTPLPDAMKSLAVLMLVLGPIGFIVWMASAADTARVAKREVEHSPGWTVAAFFIPFANLYEPMNIMKDLTRASHPKGNVDLESVTWWWWTFLGSQVGMLLLVFLLRDAPVMTVILLVIRCVTAIASFALMCRVMMSIERGFAAIASDTAARDAV